MGGGIKSSGVPKTSLIGRTSLGDENYGVTPKGNGVPGGDVLGQGGDENSPAAQANKGAVTK